MQSPFGKPSLAADAVAGLSIAGLLLPEAVAYSGIANLPPQAGIIGLIAGLACYGLIGTSRFADRLRDLLFRGSTRRRAVYRSLAAMRDCRSWMAGALVLITGAYFFVAGFAKLGNITDFYRQAGAARIYLWPCADHRAAPARRLMAGAHPSSGYTPVYAVQLAQSYANWNQAGVLVGAAAARSPVRPCRACGACRVVSSSLRLALLQQAGWDLAHRGCRPRRADSSRPAISSPAGA